MVVKRLTGILTSVQVTSTALRSPAELYTAVVLHSEGLDGTACHAWRTIVTSLSS